MGRSTSTTSGRPDSKVENLCTINGQNGLICYSIPNALTPTYKHNEEVRRNLVDGYVEDGVEIQYINNIRPTSGSETRLEVDLSLSEAEKLFQYGDTIFHNGKAYIVDMVSYHYSHNTYINIKSAFHPVNTVYGKPIMYMTKSPYLVTQGSQTTTDLIGDPSPYNSTDALYISPTSTSITDMPTNTLVWDNATGKMYKAIVDTNDLDANGLPVPVFTNTTAWTQVNKGYHIELRNRLASGKGVGFMNALLVGQDGTNYVNGSAVGNWKYFTLTKKSIDTVGKLVFFDMDTGTYSIRTDSGISSIYSSNVIETRSSGTSFINFASYTAQNQPAIPISTPQPIQGVDRNLLASNSHSIYAYNGLTYASSSKIATGNSVESKYVEDAVVHYGKGTIDVGTVINAYINDVYFINGAGGLVDTDAIGKFYKRINSDLLDYTVVTSTGFSASANWIEAECSEYINITHIPTIPTHNALVLDANSIVGSKALLTQTANATQVFTQEMIWDSTNNDFGDTGQFDQLIAGTTTDWNSNTVQTKVLLKPSSILLGDK